MNRIRITAGELTSDQAPGDSGDRLRARATASSTVTTRANLQVQGLGIEQLPEVADRLAAVGLTSKQSGHDNIRNVFAHPFSGLLPDELIDTRQLCRDVTALFVDSREYSDLPRKFNICLNGTAEHSVHFWTQDLSFLAHRVGRDVLFQVLVAGTQGQNPHLAWHLPVLVHPDQVVAVTAALLDLFRAQGSREKRHQARLRYLVERIGHRRRRGLDRRAGAAAPPGRTCRPRRPQRATTTWWAGSRRRSRISGTMGLCVPLGRLSWRQLEALAVLANRWGDGQLRTTHEQGLAVVNIPGGFRDAAATDAAAVGLSMHADTLARNTVACTGDAVLQHRGDRDQGRDVPPGRHPAAADARPARHPHPHERLPVELRAALHRGHRPEGRPGAAARRRARGLRRLSRRRGGRRRPPRAALQARGWTSTSFRSSSRRRW